MYPRILFFIVLFAIKVNAQNNCTSTHPLFTFNEKAIPDTVHILGNSPQIDFLRGITDSDKFLAAIKLNRESVKYKKDINELNGLLKIIGFERGIDDGNFNKSSLSFKQIPFGTVGNLGDNKQHYQYCALMPPNIGTVPGWKITSPQGCSIYIFTKCGNVFYPRSPIVSECPPCPKLVIDFKGKSIEDTCKTGTKDTVSIEVYAFCDI